MSQCVPSWDLDDHPNLPTHPPFNHLPSRASLVPRSDYEVTELAWENGRLVLHALGRQRIEKPIPKEPSSSSTAAAAWEKPRPSGTLEAVVDQATRPQLHPSTLSPDLAAWLAVPQVNRSTKAAMDAIVPCTNASSDNIAQPVIGRKRPRFDGEGRWVCASQGSTAVPEAGRTGESTRPTLDTGQGDDVGFTTTTATNSASPSRAEGEEGGSPETENTSFDGGVGGGGGGGRRKLMASDDRDSVCLCRRSEEDCDGVCADEEKIMKGSAGRVSASTRTGRAAVVHNQSERKRRDRINQRIQTLQKLVPNSSKTDKASILDEVIEYLKKLQAQVQMMSRMSTMMMPMAMPHFQMSMMAHMAQMVQMGMGMGMMDLNSRNQLGYAGLPPFVHPSTFLPLSSSCWAGSSDKMQQPGGTILSDPFSAFVAYQTAQQQLPPPPLAPPVGMDAYNWMAALYQQLNQQPPPGNPKP